MYVHMNEYACEFEHKREYMVLSHMNVSISIKKHSPSTIQIMAFQN